MEADFWRQWQAMAAQFASLGQSPSHAARGAQGPGFAFGFSPFIDSAERFAAEARSFMDSGAGASATSMAEAARKFGDFLRDQAAAVQPPWTAAFGFGNPDAADWAGAARRDWPAMGATREHQQRMQRMAQAWSRLDEAQRRLQRLWSDTLREAAAEFASRVGAAQPAAPSAEAFNELYDTWIDCAEDAYSRTAHSDEFCAALADYANAGSRWRGEMQAAIEEWAKMLDLPTRSEVNTLEKRLKSVEEQLRAAPRERAAKPEKAAKSAKTAKSGKPARRKAKT